MSMSLACTGGAHVALAMHSDPGFTFPTTATEKPLEWLQEGADQYEPGMSLFVSE